ncbi:HD domain-containing protein [Marinomonas sp. C2222]|uniref:HD domain-containing protein n=1 Tax=Marinomonas sargassi TaxID=2984494 RepID=A0ABT2YR74_9GAMM|nr:HD domain-containing protein [Marinomonas sargassi]MCV2402392.1 HD domain-containing protein [Marinomonas sargassi]
MMNDRLLQQVQFLNEVEKLKLVFRANKTLDSGREENSAEHSWHVALMAIIFSENSNLGDVDLLKVVKMLLIHDLVEIDAGDTWAYAENQQSKFVDEQQCAQRIFSILPKDQADEFIHLWHEFEERQTDEAKYASAIDGLQPLINHLLTGDPTSAEGKIAVEKVRAKKAYIKEFVPSLWPVAESMINQSAEVGLYVE